MDRIKRETPKGEHYLLTIVALLHYAKEFNVEAEGDHNGTRIVATPEMSREELERQYLQKVADALVPEPTLLEERMSTKDIFNVHVCVRDSGLNQEQTEAFIDAMEATIRSMSKYTICKDAGITVNRIIDGHKRNRECKDCGQECIMFAVNDELWRIIAIKDRRCILCLDCAEKRLGRKIVMDDLKKQSGWYDEVKQIERIINNSKG